MMRDGLSSEVPAIPSFDSTFKADPYPFYRCLRDSAPISRVRLPSGIDAWLATGYSEVRQLLGDPRLSKNSQNANESWHAVHIMRQGDTSRPIFEHLLTMDPPRHTRLRALVAKCFTGARVKQLRARIQDIADDFINPIASRGYGDLIDDFAFHMPVMVICELLGIPGADRRRFRTWSTLLVAAEQDEQQQVLEAAAQLREYLTQLAAMAQDKPDAGLYASLARLHLDGQLTEDELVAMGFLLLVAGHETTVNLIGNGMLALLRNPGQLAALQADEALVPNAVEEFLRYDGALAIATPRFAAEPISIGHVSIRPGDVVFLALAAADRDPARFPNPDQLDVRRDTSGHLAFGRGIHHCLGAALARLEGEIAFTTILRRLPGIRLAVADDELRWRPGLIMRGLRQLPVIHDGALSGSKEATSE